MKVLNNKVIKMNSKLNTTKWFIIFSAVALMATYICSPHHLAYIFLANGVVLSAYQQTAPKWYKWIMYSTFLAGALFLPSNFWIQ